MDHIAKHLEGAKEQLTRMSSSQSLTRSKDEVPEWLPIELTDNYNRSDLDYRYCVGKFAELQAAKRDTIPQETMRVWYKEFIRRNWTKGMFDQRYNALLSDKMFGATTIDNWINAVETFAQDEVQMMIKLKVDSIIQRGKFLMANKEKIMQLTDEDKKAIDAALAKEFEFNLRNERGQQIDDYREVRRQRFSSIHHNASFKDE